VYPDVVGRLGDDYIYPLGYKDAIMTML
jgi:hypothetical protein